MNKKLTEIVSVIKEVEEAIKKEKNLSPSFKALIRGRLK